MIRGNAGGFRSVGVRSPDLTRRRVGDPTATKRGAEGDLSLRAILRAQRGEGEAISSPLLEREEHPLPDLSRPMGEESEPPESSFSKGGLRGIPGECQVSDLT